METTLVERPEQTHASETEVRIRDCIEMLLDETSELNQLFYGETGITPTPLEKSAIQIPGHLTLYKDETNHAVQLGEQTYQAASFKRRGAFLAALLAYQENPQIAKYVTASHGNHAIGVAIAGRILGIPVEVHCPRDTHQVKQTAITELGAKIVSDYDSFELSMQGARESEMDASVHLIHPFDQAEVMAGQGTILLEIYQDLVKRQDSGELNLHTTPLVISFAVAGGGMLMGNMVVLRILQERGLIGTDNVTILGAQMENCDAMMRCHEGRIATAKTHAAFSPNEFDLSCDSTAVEVVSSAALEATSSTTFIRVRKPEVARAMFDHVADLGGLSEPAAGLSRAALQQFAREQTVATPAAEKVVLIDVICGANVTEHLFNTYMKFLPKDVLAYLPDSPHTQLQRTIAFRELSRRYSERPKNPIQEINARQVGKHALRGSNQVWSAQQLRTFPDVS